MLPADCWDSQHDLAFQLHIGTPSPLPFSCNEIRARLDLGTNAERAQNEYLCKQVDVADQLFEEILAHAKDAWETIEVFMQRNQISICLGRYDVRCSPT